MCSFLWWGRPLLRAHNSRESQTIEEGAHSCIEFMYGCVWQPSCCKKWARINFNGFLCAFWSTKNDSFHRRITMLTVGRSMEALVVREIEGRPFWLMDRAFFFLAEWAILWGATVLQEWDLILCVETIVKNRLEWYLGSWADGFSPR